MKKTPPPPTGWTEYTVVPLVKVPDARCPWCDNPIRLEKKRPTPKPAPEVLPISRK